MRQTAYNPQSQRKESLRTSLSDSNIPARQTLAHLPFHELLFTSVQSSQVSGIKDNNVTVLGFLVALRSTTGYNQCVLGILLN